MREEWQESRPPACTPTLHGACRHIKDLRGLSHGVPLHIDEDEGGALFRGEGAHGFDQFAVQVLALCWCLGGFMRFEELIEALRVIDGRGLPRRGFTGPVEAGVDRDAVQPGGDGGLAAKGVCGTVGGDQGVLDGVGSLLAVAERTQSDGPEPVSMAPYQLTEGVGVAGDVGSQQLLVAGGTERGVVQR